MHVIATAGHVDHGKSTLVQALTGTNPDRLAAERERGLTIELGYCWTELPGAGEVAFVDVPGHERFVTTMLSGVGPVPAVLFVVAADDPWMPQAAEHLAALDALGVAHGVVVVSRSDLADPAAAVARARHEVSRTSLAGAPVVPVSAVTGAGLNELRDALVAMVRSLPDPDPDADVRLWADRSFHVRGSGLVVTGTLPAGRISVGDTLVVAGRPLRVRGLQSLGRPESSVTGVSRVAVNLAGADRADVDRHSVLVSPDRWHFTDIIDVRLSPAPEEGPGVPPQRPLLHIGAAAVPAYARPLGDALLRVTLHEPLPLRVGDRALLRDPGSRRIWGVAVLDPAPPALRRRGAARARAAALHAHTGAPDLDAEVERRGIVHVDLLRRIGVPVPHARAGRAPDGWLVGAAHARRMRERMAVLVTAHDTRNPLDPGAPVSAVTDRLGLPTARVTQALVAPPLSVVDGRVTVGPSRSATELPEPLRRAVDAVTADLRVAPFAAPTADRLREVGLDPKSLAAAARSGALLSLGDGIVLLPGAAETARDLLAGLRQPFTTSEARQRLGTTRRVVLPLLAHLDRRGLTRRHPDDRRSVT